jgi:hypothetical protein
MNVKKITGAGIILLCLNMGATAQLGGLINRTKDKLKDKVTNGTDKIKNSGTKTGTDNSETGSGNGVSGTVNNVKKQVAAETEWQIGGDEGYSSGGIKYNLDMLEREKPISPYQHMRKVGETGCFHFAKDYAELKGIAEPEPANYTVSFSSEPFKGGNGTPAAKFTSAEGHIYARLQIKGAGIKEFFKLGDDDMKLTVDFYSYETGGDEIRSWRQQTTIYLKAGDAAKSVIDFDIKPAPSAITSYYDPKDKYSFYLSQFPFIHDQRFFSKSGNYTVGVRVVAALKNEWGVITGQKIEAMGTFDYAFAVKDVKTIYDEGQVVMKALQTGIKLSPKPMPKEWKQASAAPAVPGYTAAKYNELYSRYYKDVKIVKTILAPTAGATWKVIMSNDNIMPAYKYCTQTVFFFVKDAAGNCYYHPCDLRQDYAGGGTYSDIHLAVFDEEKVYVSCAEMK